MLSVQLDSPAQSIDLDSIKHLCQYKICMEKIEIKTKAELTKKLK